DANAEQIPRSMAIRDEHESSRIEPLGTCVERRRPSEQDWRAQWARALCRDEIERTGPDVPEGPIDKFRIAGNGGDPFAVRRPGERVRDVYRRERTRFFTA